MEVSSRRINDMKNVLYDRSWAKTAHNFEVYFMHRGIKRKGDLRYDITVIPPRLLGKEYAKTKGHEHLGNYGELYITLGGKAIYLLQNYKNGKIKDVYAIKSGKGGVVVIPPGYGHFTINPSRKEELKTANWLYEESRHDYGVIDKKHGACYYYTINGWVKNKNYKKIPKLRFEKPLKLAPRDLSFLKG